MKYLQRSMWFAVVLTFFVIQSECSLSYGQEDPPQKNPTKTYRADFTIYSIIPAKGIESYRRGGFLSVTPGMSSESGITSKTQRIQIAAVGRLNHQRFIVDVKIMGLAKFDQKPPQEIDFTDLRAETIELAEDEDGRVYRVNITPQVVEYQPTKVFRAQDELLEEWSFQQSPVVLNDQDYLGEIGMSGGTLAEIDVPGLARIQFSLLPLKGSRPEGTLHHGVISIRHEDQVLTIKNVGNGATGESLKGGPYTVFVRWTSPSQTVAEYRNRLSSMVDVVRGRFSKGSDAAADAQIARLEKMLTSDRVFLLGSSIWNAKESEIERTK